MEDDQRNSTLLRCIQCDNYIEENRSFRCRQCGKSPLCLKHMDRQYRICSRCAIENRLHLYNKWISDHRHVRVFLRLTQFLFILATLFFAALRFYGKHLPDYARENIFAENLYLIGGLAAAGMLFSYIIMKILTGKIEKIEDSVRHVH
jgi:hypothetical protein